jgi:hypothetical protein
MLVMLQVFQTLPVAPAYRDQYAIDLHVFGGICINSVEGNNKRTMDAPEAVCGQQVLYLMRTHFRNVFAFGGNHFDVFPLAFDVKNVGEENFYLLFLYR